MARTKSAKNKRKKAAEDDTNCNTGAVLDENTVDDEGPNKNVLVPVVSTGLRRCRVSGGDAEAKINDGERDVDDAEVDDAKSDDDDDESQADDELAPRRERVMSQANMLIKARKKLEGKKRNAAPLFDSATCAPTPGQCAAAREAKRAKQIARHADTVKQSLSLQPLAIGGVQLMHTGGVATRRGSGQGVGGGKRGGQSNCGIGGHRERACRGRVHRGARRGP